MVVILLPFFFSSEMIQGRKWHNDSHLLLLPWWFIWPTVNPEFVSSVLFSQLRKIQQLTENLSLVSATLLLLVMFIDTF